MDMIKGLAGKLKSKAFWAGVATTVAALLTGAMTAPEAIIQILTSFIGG